MSTVTIPAPARLILECFNPSDAVQIAKWVETDQELLWLAPNTEPPLTAEKVLDWRRPGSVALVAKSCEGEAPFAYGELNPMKNEPAHLWLGHAIVHPQRRGGTGQAFVRALLHHAFDRLGANRVSLVVFPQNRVAVGCYRRIGFTIVGEEFHAFGASSTPHRLLRLDIKTPRSAWTGPNGPAARRIRKGSPSCRMPRVIDR